MQAGAERAEKRKQKMQKKQLTNRDGGSSIWAEQMNSCSNEDMKG